MNKIAFRLSDIAAIRRAFGQYGVLPENVIFYYADKELTINWAENRHLFRGWDRENLWFVDDGRVQHQFDSSDISGISRIADATFFCAFIMADGCPKGLVAVVWPGVETEKMKEILKQRVG